MRTLMTLKINSDLVNYSSAVPMLARYGINLNILHNCNSPYKLAHANRPDVVISMNANKITTEFPHIKFVGPQCKFPNYEYNPVQGFNAELCDIAPPSELKSKVIFINRQGPKNKLFIKKIESIGLSPFVLGDGFGIAQINYGKKEPIESLYKSAEFVAATSVEDIYRALYLGKMCITPWEFPHCNNIFKSAKLTMNPAQIEFAKQFDWKNIFGEILAKIDEEIPW